MKPGEGEQDEAVRQEAYTEQNSVASFYRWQLAFVFGANLAVCAQTLRLTWLGQRLTSPTRSSSCCNS